MRTKLLQNWRYKDWIVTNQSTKLNYYHGWKIFFSQTCLSLGIKTREEMEVLEISKDVLSNYFSLYALYKLLICIYIFVAYHSGSCMWECTLCFGSLLGQKVGQIWFCCLYGTLSYLSTYFPRCSWITLSLPYLFIH